MGKHKHRQREMPDNYMQDQMNNNYTNGYNGNPMNPAMQMNNGQMNNGQMNMQQPVNPMMGNNMMNNQMQSPMNNQMQNSMGNMMGGNGLAQLLSILGLGGGQRPQGMPGGDILSMLTGGQGQGTDILSMLGGQGQGADILSMLGGNEGGGGDLISSLGSLLGLGGQQPVQNTEEKKSISLEEFLAQISDEDLNELQRAVNNMQNEKEGKKKDDSVEEILANLNFNSILENINDSNLDFSNVDISNLDIEDIIKDDDGKEAKEEYEQENIVEGNIINNEKGLTEEEYIKLINLLIRLIDPNKIKLLKKVVEDYGKNTLDEKSD